VIQGYNQIRLSVVALSRVFEFGDVVDGIMVRGEEITEPASAGRIVTRSQRRKGISSNKKRYTDRSAMDDRAVQVEDFEVVYKGVGQYRGGRGEWGGR